MKKLKKISIIGSGVVGSASGKGLIEKGYEVSFVDVNQAAIDNLKSQNYNACHIKDMCADDSDVYLVSVSTPTVNEKIDQRYLKSAAADLGTVLSRKKDYSVVVVRSTVPPGTTENIVKPILEKFSGKKAGKDFGLAMNPEFLREKTAKEDFVKPWLVVIGSLDEKSAKRIDEMYKPFGAPIKHMSLKEAEMLKYVHNLYNANKISFFNEMRMVAQDLNINPDKVFRTVMDSAEASWNKEYGIKDRGPFDGMCLPKDTMAFLSWARENLGKNMTLLKAVIDVNEELKSKNFMVARQPVREKSYLD